MKTPTVTITPPASAPIRRRKLATAEVENKPSASLVSLAAQVLALNKEMNASKKAYDDKREELFREMKSNNFRDFNATAIVNGKQVSFDAMIAAPTSTAIDVAKLRNLVTDEVFMACVGATKSSVDAQAGSAVTAQCSVSVKGNENVSVKPSKG